MSYGSLFRRWGRLDEAAANAKIATDIIDKAGDISSMGWISTMSAYHVACVAILRKEVAKAIDAAKKATLLAKLSKSPEAIRARLHQVLAKALYLDPDRQEEASNEMKEARRLRALLPVGRSDPNHESDEAWEALLVILAR